MKVPNLDPSYLDRSLNARTNAILWIFREFYSDALGYFKVSDLKMYTKNTWFFRYSDIESAPLKAELLARFISSQNTDLYMSLATFRTKKHAAMEDIISINAFAVDIDYKRDPDQYCVPVSTVISAVRAMELDGIIPVDSYIEYGHCIRVVYLLEKPFIIPVHDKKKRRSAVKMAERMMNMLCERMNSCPGSYFGLKMHAEPHKLTSFVRVPGSVNTKDGSVIGISVPFYGQGINKYTFASLSGAVLPALPSWYPEWKKDHGKKRRMRKKTFYHSMKDVAVKRMNAYREFQRRGYGKGYREKLCFHFWLAAFQSGMSSREAEAAVLQFNEGFQEPLSSHSVLCECRPTDYTTDGIHFSGCQRKFKNSTILKDIGISESDYDVLSSEKSGAVRTAEYRKREASKRRDNGSTKKAKVLRLERKAAKLSSIDKMGASDIAVFLKVSVTTARRYIKEGLKRFTFRYVRNYHLENSIYRFKYVPEFAFMFNNRLFFKGIDHGWFEYTDPWTKDALMLKILHAEQIFGPQ